VIAIVAIFGLDWLKIFRKARKTVQTEGKLAEGEAKPAKEAALLIEPAGQVADATRGVIVAPKTLQQLLDEAAELGIGIESLAIEGTVARVKISYLSSVAEGGVDGVGAFLKQAGVSKVLIDSGPVVEDVLAKRLRQLANRGDTYKGARVRLVKEVESSLIPGRRIPYFELEYIPE
jgi:hypothetical protein